MSRPIVAVLINDIIIVNERQIEWAIGALIEHQRTISEGAGVAGLTAIYASEKRFCKKRVGIVVCGRNIDSRFLGTILNRTLISDGRLVRTRIGISDEPGMLAKITHSISQHQGNIIELYHQRSFYSVSAKLAKLDVVIETRGSMHAHDIILTRKSIGFEVHLLDEQFQSH